MAEQFKRIVKVASRAFIEAHSQLLINTLIPLRQPLYVLSELLLTMITKAAHAHNRTWTVTTNVPAQLPSVLYRPGREVL